MPPTGSPLLTTIVGTVPAASSRSPRPPSFAARGRSAGPMRDDDHAERRRQRAWFFAFIRCSFGSLAPRSARRSHGRAGRDAVRLGYAGAAAGAGRDRGRSGGRRRARRSAAPGRRERAPRDGSAAARRRSARRGGRSPRSRGSGPAAEPPAGQQRHGRQQEGAELGHLAAQDNVRGRAPRPRQHRRPRPARRPRLDRRASRSRCRR